MISRVKAEKERERKEKKKKRKGNYTCEAAGVASSAL